MKSKIILAMLSPVVMGAVLMGGIFGEALVAHADDTNTTQKAVGKSMFEPKSKRITVGLLGTPPLWSYKAPEGEKAIEFMIDMWTKELRPVLADNPDLIVLPEACDRFSAMSMEDRKAYYTLRGNKIRDFFAKVAKDNNCYIAYSAARKMEDGTFRNSTQLIDRKGEVVGVYNKNHLVPGETTEGGILCGKDAPIFETDFGTVAMAICFDLNFDELLEKYAKAQPDVIIFSSLYHGGLMQNYWAYRCRSYFVSSVGGEECTVVNPVGTTVARTTNYYHYVTATINLDNKVVHLDENWDKFHALKDKYGRGVTRFDPGNVGAVLLTSEMADKSIDEIIEEFEIETWDEYYDRSMKHRHTPGNMEE